MSETRFTPGPWVANFTRFSGVVEGWHIAASEWGSTLPLCEGLVSRAQDAEQCEANASLIAAAPDLYELAHSYEAWEADVVVNAVWDAALPRLTQEQWDRLLELQAARNAALSKARGESA